MSITFRLLTEHDVTQVLSMDDLIDSMATALTRFSAGEVVQPVRPVVIVEPVKAFMAVMPAYTPHPAALGTKLVTVFHDNAAKKLPSHLATILLMDPATGALVAVMDGRYITEARTAAVSAVSSRLLATAGASTLAIIGSGVQARSHLEALGRVHALKDVRVWSPNAQRLRQFVEEARGRTAATLSAAASAADAVRGADIVVLVTASPRPVIEAGWVTPGAHVISVGATRPDQREIDPRLTERARFFVDSREAALVECGDIVMGVAEQRFGLDHIAGELGAAVAGTIPGRQSADQITIFKSLGMAVEDVVAADLAYRRACERGIGQELML
ncbi:MAG: ornithine cyclodeaminase family protein [Acidobacteriota bacterium]|nr:ornithine cyclodeaminase family protein [Acidobacteriota bacterium]